MNILKDSFVEFPGKKQGLYIHILWFSEGGNTGVPSMGSRALGDFAKANGHTHSSLCSSATCLSPARRTGPFILAIKYVLHMKECAKPEMSVL